MRLNETVLLETFQKFFIIQIAQTQEEKARAYKLRYDVFCEEFQFERQQDFSNQMEIDIYDPRAIHCLIIHKESLETAGCVRLLLPTYALDDHPLPFESFCYPQFLPRLASHPIHFGETSRLTVSRHFRRRRVDPKHPAGMEKENLNPFHFPEIFSRKFPMVAVSLILSSAVISKKMSLDYVFAMMEPRLAAAMRRYGIYFEQVGDLIEYRGQRAAFRIVPAQVWEDINPVLRPFLNYLETTLEDYLVLSKTA